jgi:cadmium resistance protein CadD (predicted permease)
MVPITPLAIGVVSFVTTNVEDVLVLLLLMAQPRSRVRPRAAMAGYCLGFATLVLLSLLGAAGLHLLPDRLAGLLGLVPIAIGLWMLSQRRRERASADAVAAGYRPQGEVPAATRDRASADAVAAGYRPQGEISAARMFWLTITQGSDNLVVYIPLFQRLDRVSIIVVLASFAAMLALYCLLAYRLGRHPALDRALQRIGRLEPPFVFIAVGTYVFVFDGLRQWL